MKSLSEMLEQTRAWDSVKADATTAMANALFYPGRELHVPTIMPEGVGYKLEDNALRQLCDRLALKGGYKFFTDNTDLPDQPVVDILNDRMIRKDKDALFRTFGGNVRAVLSDRYAPIDNTQVLETLSGVVDVTGERYEIRSLHLTPNEMSFRLYFSDPKYGHLSNTPDGGLPGMYVANGETGGRSLKIYPFIFIQVCSNGLVRQMAEARMVHMVNRHHSVGFIKTWIVEAATQAVGRSYELADKLMEAHRKEIPDLSSVLAKFAKQNQLPQGFDKVAATGTNDESTLAGFVNGITFAAHRMDGLTQDQMDTVEIAAGSALELDATGDELVRALFRITVDEEGEEVEYTQPSQDYALRQ